MIGIGHSAGGQTMAMLAGARYDLRRLAAHCASDAGKSDLSCNYGRDAGKAPESFVAIFDANYQDTRVKKIVLLDPALGSAVRQDSLQAIALPTLFVGAKHSEILPWESHGARYVAALPNARTLLLQGEEGHFVFLTPCRYDVKVFGIALCEDRPGVDRSAVQAAISQTVLDFVRPDDEPATVKRLEGGRVRSTPIPSNPILQILYFTPPWVFGMLSGLVISGLMQARTRRVPLWFALLFPAAMLMLSLSGVVSDAGLSWPALTAWLVGVAAATVLVGTALLGNTKRPDDGDLRREHPQAHDRRQLDPAARAPRHLLRSLRGRRRQGDGSRDRPIPGGARVDQPGARPAERILRRARLVLLADDGARSSGRERRS